MPFFPRKEYYHDYVGHPTHVIQELTIDLTSTQYQYYEYMQYCSTQ